jgi:hypothetical protein
MLYENFNAPISTNTLEYPLQPFPCMHNSSLIYSLEINPSWLSTFFSRTFSSQVDCTLMHKEDSRDSYRRCSEKCLKRIRDWGEGRKCRKWGWMSSENTSRGNCWKAIIFSADFMLILIFKMKSCKKFLPSSLISTNEFWWWCLGMLLS